MIAFCNYSMLWGVYWSLIAYYDRVFGICGSFVVAEDDDEELFTTFELTCLECMVADPSTKSSAAACRCWALITCSNIEKMIKHL